MTDLVTLTVIHNYLISTCREMGVAMMRTSYSPIFNESLDFSCVLFNRQGRLISQAESRPSHIRTLNFTVECVLGLHAGLAPPTRRSSAPAPRRSSAPLTDPPPRVSRGPTPEFRPGDILLTN